DVCSSDLNPAAGAAGHARASGRRRQVVLVDPTARRPVRGGDADHRGGVPGLPPRARSGTSGRRTARPRAQAGMSRREGETLFGDGTRCVHGGQSTPAPGAPLHPGPVFAAPYHLGGADSQGADHYGRAGNPTWRALEAAIGDLDGGRCVLLPSGMAAVSTLLHTVLRNGDGLVLPSDGYYATREFVREELGGLGLRVREVPTAGPGEDDVFDGVRLVLLETPTNPGLDHCGISALAERAHGERAMKTLYNRAATPLGQLPLMLVADIVIASATKGLPGLSEMLMGHISVRDPALADRFVRARIMFGSIPGPIET